MLETNNGPEGAVHVLVGRVLLLKINQYGLDRRSAEDGPLAGPSAEAVISPPFCSPSITPTTRCSAKWQLGSLIHHATQQGTLAWIAVVRSSPDRAATRLRRRAALEASGRGDNAGNMQELMHQLPRYSPGHQADG